MVVSEVTSLELSGNLIDVSLLIGEGNPKWPFKGIVRDFTGMRRILFLVMAFLAD